MILIVISFALASCGTTKIVDTCSVSMPVGTIHKNDTPKTKRWMRSYETRRQEMIK